MKSLISLWSSVAQEMATRCSTSATNDIKTVVSRTEHEGLSFLAITLADYGKVIQKWLDLGLVDPSDSSSFKTNSRTGFPVFLQGFLGRVFNPVSGALLDNPDIEAILALRQLTLMFSKIALPEQPLRGCSSVVSPRRERRAMSDFVQCEHDVKRNDSLLDTQFLEHFKRISGMLYDDLFAKVDRDIYWGRVIPKHGPGAVADRLSSNAKYNLRSWPARMCRVFPPHEFLRKGEYDIVEPRNELPVRVITVPKTLKTPRIIAIEPTAMQYAQQGLLASILSAVKEDGFLSRVIGFDDQEPNRQMAQEGSFSGNLATLDLSEASDRVSNQLVRAMLEDHPQLLEAVDSCRSRKADVPGHGVIRLSKFASMGSALCFPFEAMVFLTIILVGIESEQSAPLSRRDIKSLVEQVRVFGDDLIVPRDYVLSIVDMLHTFGCVVNIGKSFWTGRFRESCGREYFDGHDVSIVKVRRVFPTRLTDVEGVESLVSLRNQLYMAGLWRSTSALDVRIKKLLKGNFPTVLPSSPLLGRVSSLGYQYQRLHPKYQSPLTRGYFTVPRIPIDKLDGYGALHKCLLRMPKGNLFGLPKREPIDNLGDVASVY
jgi:hypothetical protein